MTDITKFSAAMLVKLYNFITDRQHKKKFESQPAGMRIVTNEIHRMNMSVDDAVARFQARPTEMGLASHTPAAPTGGLMTVTFPALPAPTVTDLLTGETRPRPDSVHGPVRRVEGNPAKAARRAAQTAAAPFRALRLVDSTPAAPVPSAHAPVAAPVMRAGKLPSEGGPARTNHAVPAMVEALKRQDGASLEELTRISGWRLPVEMTNLRIMARKVGFTLADDGRPGASRRFYARFLQSDARAG